MRREVLILLFLVSCVSAGFVLSSLDVYVNVNENGNAAVEERIKVFINSWDSRDLYESTRQSQADLAVWKERIGLPDIRYHVDTGVVNIKDLRIDPQKLEGENYVAGTAYATLVLSYNVFPYEENGSVSKNTGLFLLNKIKPRTTRYVLNRDALSFELSEGDLLLKKNTKLTLRIPQDASRISFSVPPFPENIKEEEELLRLDKSDNKNYYIGNARQFTWSNTKLPKFEFSYEREESLEEEISQFFDSLSKNVSDLIKGPQGIAVLIIILLLLSSYVYLNRLKK